MGMGDDEGSGLLCSLNAKTGFSVFILPVVQGELIWKNYRDSLATYILPGLGITWRTARQRTVEGERRVGQVTSYIGRPRNAFAMMSRVSRKGKAVRERLACSLGEERPRQWEP